MEASALQVPVGLARGRTALGSSLLRLRSDEQLVAQFRDGNDDAFCVIHDRYRQRLFAYTRQMFPGSKQDAEDAVQDVFVRAYSGLRANDRDLALRAWLYRVAHNRCIDQLRRPPVPAPELLERGRFTMDDPIDQAEQRDSLRRLIADVRRLPEQQRSALLMRELGGMSYEELSRTLGLSVPAVKSSLVRARISLAQSAQSRDTPCCEIREELTLAHDRGVRASASARRHLRECTSCSDFRSALRGTSRQFAALVPALGPAGVLANMLGIGGGSSGGAAATGAFGGGAAAAGGVTFISAGHVATLLAAAAVTTGGALEIHHTIAASAPPIKQAIPWTAPSNAAAQPAGVFPVTEKSAPSAQGAAVPSASAPVLAR
jgi:RNA polymerase sigma factor (sigma-70 family)